LGGLVGASDKAAALVAQFERNLDEARVQAATLQRRPRVYFEEWDDPQISAIGWVSELIGIAGGDDIFPERARQSLGRDRIVAEPREVIERSPDIVMGSWCGKAGRSSRPSATASSTKSSRR
jgi:iron complex transport system substrate-binding protein